MEFSHIPVLLREVLSALAPERGGIYVDCTAGGGGHSSEIAALLPEGSRLVCFDRDDEAIEACSARLAPYDGKWEIVKTDFRNLDAALDMLGIEQIDGVLWDLGVSSHQIDTTERGFSYTGEDAPLDMRMDRTQGLSAADIVNTYSEEELRRVIRDYGEERFAGRIASAIVERRAEAPIETTLALAETVSGAIPKAQRVKEAQHPARRTFQALRIETNGELDAIEPSIRDATARLRPGGRLAVITFHSLEDRIVKDVFKSMSTGCTCPPDFPVCVCGGKPIVRVLTKKPILPGEDELRVNSRAHSAKLRVAEKL